MVLGGETRQQSVRAGLVALQSAGAQPREIVLIHDAARCCVTAPVIVRVVAEVEKSGAATAAVPVVDAMVRAESSCISSYIERAGLWSIQTPQGFVLEEILKAHEDAVTQGTEALDDASLVSIGRSVPLVLGDRLNIKVTTPEDLELARALIAGGVVK